jgi:hypothetical protein
MTEESLWRLVKDLTTALEDVIDGYDCYNLSHRTGWEPEHCQKIIDLMYDAKLKVKEYASDDIKG